MRPSPPPSGVEPPQAVETAEGALVDLGPPAREACRRYYEAFPDDGPRYGPAGRAWCEHDTRYLLAWALEDARARTVDCVEQVAWLGRVLGARGFPLERLRRHVEIVAAVLSTAGLGDVGTRAAARLEEAAEALPRASDGAGGGPAAG